MKTARDQLDILTAYAELGSYRATATLCGTTGLQVHPIVPRDTDPLPLPVRIVRLVIANGAPTAQEYARALKGYGGSG